MKSRLALAIFVSCGLSLGCAATFPQGITSNESYLTHPDLYTVLGQTEGTSTITSILGFPPTGDAGYRSAMDEAMRKASADGLINVVADVKHTNMLIFHQWTTTVRGLAIKKK